MAVLIACIGAAAPASALKFSHCASNAPGFDCATLKQPLDHSGSVAGSVHLKIAAQRSYPPGAKLLVALAGGPGQGAIRFASQSEETLRPLLSSYRLVVVDQRGTGASGALSCPDLQNGSLAWGAEAVRDCALQIGVRRRFYSTADTVADLDAVRAAMHAPKLALMGVSYGTWVAQEYARTHPSKTDSLILDSVVGPSQPDAFYLQTLRALPGVVRSFCSRARCAGITSNPYSDLESVVNRVAVAPLRGRVYNSHGAGRSARYRDQNELLSLLLESDLSPALQAQLPASFAAANRGDYAQLLRLSTEIGQPADPVSQFSEAVNAITSCLDYALPYDLSSAVGERSAQITSAVGALDPAAYYPFSAASVRSASAASDCQLFPPQASPARAPISLPNVPALILSGSRDLRTPSESARAVAAQIPGSSLLQLRGAGHDVIDHDLTGCVQRAVKRFAERKVVGFPCARVDATPLPAQVAPLLLSDATSPPGLAGVRGRAVSATLASVADAIAAGDVRFEAGLSSRGGGLRGGSFALRNAGQSISLDRYRYVSDLAVSGTLTGDDNNVLTGVVRLSGAVSGRLKLHGRNYVSGQIGGKAISWRATGRKLVPRRTASRLDRRTALPRIR